MKNASTPPKAGFRILNQAERIAPLGLDNEHPLTIARATAHYANTVIDKGAFWQMTWYTGTLALLAAMTGCFYKLAAGQDVKSVVAYVGVVVVLWTAFTILRYGWAKNRTTRIAEADRVMLGAFQEVLDRARKFDAKLADLYRYIDGEGGTPAVMTPEAAAKLTSLRADITLSFLRERQLFVEYGQRLQNEASARSERSLKNVAKA